MLKTKKKTKTVQHDSSVIKQPLPLESESQILNREIDFKHFEAAIAAFFFSLDGNWLKQWTDFSDPLAIIYFFSSSAS